MQPILDENSGEMLAPEAPELVKEASVMVSGVIPLIIEVNGNPLWINRDMNSPFAFRPSRFKHEVSTSSLILLVSLELVHLFCNLSR